MGVRGEMSRRRKTKDQSSSLLYYVATGNKKGHPVDINDANGGGGIYFHLKNDTSKRELLPCNLVCSLQARQRGTERGQ